MGGGYGADALNGGAGRDRFFYFDVADSSVAAAGRDIIADFDADRSDKIDLRYIDAIALGGGRNDRFTFVDSDAFTALGQVRWFQQGGNTFVDVNTAGSNAADTRIQLTGLVTLDAADFLL